MEATDRHLVQEALNPRIPQRLLQEIAARLQAQRTRRHRRPHSNEHARSSKRFVPVHNLKIVVNSFIPNLQILTSLNHHHMDQYALTPFAEAAG